MLHANLLSYFFLGITLAVPVGPVNIEVIRRCLTHGFLAGWLVGLGAVTMDTVFMLLILSGVTAFARNPVIYFTLQAGGAVVLLYLGIKSLQAAGVPFRTQGQEQQEGKKWRSYITGVFIAGFNPINIFFWIGIYGAVAAEAGSFRSGAFTAVFIISGIMFWNLLIVMLSHFSRQFITSAALKWLTKIAGGCLILFAANLIRLLLKQIF